MKPRYVLLLIILVAAALRLPLLGSVPNGLFSDEASFLINTVALKNTLRDEDNRFLPLYLLSLKDPKPALYSYIQIPFVSVFGVSTAVSRLPSAFMGIFSVYLVYLLVFKMRHDERLALLSAGVLAIQPWHVMISRSTQEIIMSFMFTVLALYYYADLDMHMRDGRRFAWNTDGWRLLLFGIASLLAMYAYHSSKIFILIYVVSMIGLRVFQSMRPDVLKRAGVTLAAVFIPLLVTISGGVARFESIGILNHDLPQAKINDFIANATGHTPPLLLRVFYNKPIFYGRYFLSQYLTHFTGNFWFLNGGNTGSQTIPSHGMLYFPDVFFMILGIAGLLRAKYLAESMYPWIVMLLASPVAAAMTVEDIPSNTRPFLMALPLAFFVAYGLNMFFGWSRHRWKVTIAVMLILGYMWSFGYFIQQYYVQGPRWHSWYRSRDYEITASAISEVYDDYDSIIVTNDLREMYIYLWLRGHISLEAIQQQQLARYKDVYKLGNVSFNKHICDFSEADDATLIVGMPECKKRFPKELYVNKITYFDDNMAEAFGLYQLASATASADLLP